MAPIYVEVPMVMIRILSESVTEVSELSPGSKLMEWGKTYSKVKVPERDLEKVRHLVK